MTQSAEAAKQFSPASSEETAAFPFNVFADQSGPMDKLYQVFMGQVAQAQLMDEVSKTTGISASQLTTLFPMLTTYGLMPLMPPALDNPAGWVDYMGDLGRRNFRQANKEFEAMPNPVTAAFDGLLTGFFPQSAHSQPEPTPPEPDQAQQVRDASLAMQANYIKSLNSLFENYQNGFGKSDEDKDG